MIFLLVALIHEVTQVVAAGNGVSPHAEEIAVTVKMIRVMILAPMLIVIGIWIAKSATTVSEVSDSKTQKDQLKDYPLVYNWFYNSRRI